MVRVFTSGLGDLGSIPGRDIPKTQKMVLDAILLNTQHYEVRIKGKELRPPLGVVAIEKGDFESPSITVANFNYYIYLYIYMFIYICVCVCVCVRVDKNWKTK